MRQKFAGYFDGVLERLLPSVLCVAAIGCLLAPSPAGGVPLSLQFQGHIKVDNRPFDGPGQFKFALLAGGSSVWTHDGTGSESVPPASAISLTVARGIYSVGLGDTNVAGMASIPVSVFTNNPLALRVWFDDGVNGLAQLAPDQAIASVAFAIRAHTAGTVESIPTGLIQEEHLPAAFVGLVNSLQAAVHSLSNQVQALSAGAVSASSQSGDTNLIAGGYQEFSSVAASDWVTGATSGQPGARRSPAGVWTGTDFIVWGGTSLSGPVNSGGVYRPATDAWTTVSPIDAPAARSGHASAWTGTRLLVWGGLGSAGWLNDGGRFDPATQTWTPISSVNAPSARSEAIGVFVNGRFIIWGGRDAGGYLGDGAAYDPVANTWTALPTANQPAARFGASAVIHGNSVIVWGGEGANGELADGAILDLANPSAPLWSAISNSGAPAVRSAHAAVWTGSQMLVWGGRAGGSILADGAAYDPVGDTWTSLPAGPTGRAGHVGVWSGTELLIWSGESVSGATATGWAFDPATGQWRNLTATGGPIARSDAAGIWSGTELILFGGANGNLPVASLQRLNPEPTLYLYRKP